VTPDVVNGTFEVAGAAFLWRNVAVLLRDRVVRGVDWRVTGFFTAWGIWNLFYYPSLHQWCSFAGGCALVAANATWVYYAIKFRIN